MGNYTFKHLNSINLKHYSQTCSNEHLCKTTNAQSAQANSHSIVTNVTSNHFFWLPNEKKNLSETITTKLYPAKECEKEQGRMHKK